VFPRIKTWFSTWRRNRQVKKARKLWAKALLSGEFKQGKGQLCNKNIDTGDFDYCCLGVGAEVYQKHVGGLNIEDRKWGKSYNDKTQLPPPEVCEWLNITPHGKLKDTRPDGLPPALTDANDNENYTFEQIAVIVQSNNLKPHGEDKPSYYA